MNDHGAGRKSSFCLNVILSRPIFVGAKDCSCMPVFCGRFADGENNQQLDQRLSPIVSVDTTERPL